MPPLRERRDDILPLARQFLATAIERVEAQDVRHHPRRRRPARPLRLARQRPRARERDRTRGRLVDGTRIDVDDLPEEVRVALPRRTRPAKCARSADVERDYILAALEANEGNRTKTAQQLRIGLATLHRKIREYERRA